MLLSSSSLSPCSATMISSARASRASAILTVASAIRIILSARSTFRLFRDSKWLSSVATRPPRPAAPVRAIQLATVTAHNHTSNAQGPSASADRTAGVKSAAHRKQRPGQLSLPSHTPTPTSLAALGVLGILCTGLPLVVFYTLIAQTGPARAALAFYLSPAFAVAFGTIFLSEDLTVSSVAGLAAIVAGSALAARRVEPIST
jgi:hypothetical protein